MVIPFVSSMDGRIRQLSSFGQDPERGGGWVGFRPSPARKKRILLAPGECRVMAQFNTPGIITRFWWTTFIPFNSFALTHAVLRIYWDGQSTPAIECPIGDLFGLPFAQARTYVSEHMSSVNHGFLCSLPMPFEAGTRIEIVNESSRVIDPFFYQITYYETNQSPSAFRLHARWHRENPTKASIPYTILDTKGSGQYIGCHLFMQNREWWLRPSARMLFPLGFGFGMLEGWDSVFVDGENSPSIIGTGTEDAFNGAWYNLRDREFSTPQFGCTLLDFLRGRVALYRWQTLSPIPFQQSIRILLEHGFENLLKADYTSVAFWYQTGSNLEDASLPGPEARQPHTPIQNIVQTLMSFGAAPLISQAVMRRTFR